MKKSVIIPAALVIYLVVMALIGYPRMLSGEVSSISYFGLITVTLGVIYGLRRNLVSREKKLNPHRCH